MDSRTEEAVNRVNYLFELGKTRSLSGNFIGSIRLLEEASTMFVQNKDFNKYMECTNILLRIHKEMENVEKISLLKEELLEVAWENDIKLSSSIRCTLGLCALYLGNISEAQEEFEKALNQEKNLELEFLKKQDETGILRARIHVFTPLEALTLISIYYDPNKNIEQVQQELEHLERLLQSFKNLEKELEEGRRIDERFQLKAVLKETSSLREKFEFNTQFLRAEVLRLQGRYRLAEEVLWKWYDQVQKSKDLWSTVTFFYYLGRNCLDMEDYERATIFLNLAKKSIDATNFKHLNNLVQGCLAKLQSIVSAEYDLIVDLDSYSVVEKHKGKVNFKNQYILFNLMRMFLEQPGKIYSKEDLIQNIWKQKYNPLMDDNKIYVTIKRLRQLMEPDSKSVRYICCGKEGYYLNRKVKILLRGEENSKKFMHNNQEVVL